LAFGSPDKTLSGEEADKAQAEIKQVMQKKFNAQLRDS